MRGIWNRIKLQHKILLGYLLPVVALIGATIWGSVITKQVAINFQRVSFVANFSDRVHHVQIAHLQMSNGVRGYLNQQDEIFLETDREGEMFFAETIRELESDQLSLQRFKSLFPETEWENFTELQKHVEEVIEKIALYDQLSNQMAALVQDQQQDQANQLFRQQDGEEINRNFTEINRHLHEIYERLVIQEQELIDESLGLLLQGLILLAVGLGGLAAIFVMFIAKGISRSIHRTSNLITQSTLEILHTVTEQEETVNTQARSVNSTTTTVEELGVSSQNCTDQAKTASLAAQEALTVAETGNQAVEETLQGMMEVQEKVEKIVTQITRLREQNNQIGTISQVVSNIANQTNMLALNASVEAVRAGESGKGFAVVAAEIRKLADQSKSSADKINHLVIEIQSAVEATAKATGEGTERVQASLTIAKQSSQAFSGVTEAVNNMVISNQQIALNIQQQAIAIQDIVKTMNDLNHSAQQVVIAIRQTRQETEQLNQASDELKMMV
jgi:uncharacterized protein YoxC